MPLKRTIKVFAGDQQQANAEENCSDNQVGTLPLYPKLPKQDGSCDDQVDEASPRSR